MKIKTDVKGGKIAGNENPTVVSGVVVKTKLRAGKLAGNENPTVVRTTPATR